VAPPATAAWSPQAPAYGIASQTNQAITASDGTVLRADVYYPTDPKTGKAATGPFPVILSQTPYGKEAASAGGSTLGELAGYAPYLIQRGYIQVIADVRGTGGSQGTWGLFDPVQGTDGATLVDWSSKLAHANGTVGLLGASYLGIDQFATTVDAGPHSPVKAMFPIISGNDLYRDVAYAGGLVDIEFGGFYLGLTGSLNIVNPLVEGNSDVPTALAQHVGDLASFDAAFVASALSGGDQAYDQAYWQARNPVNEIQQIADDGVPAFLVGGWYDLFQRGELLNYSSFQNAYSHRPVLAPMSPTQPVTPRYQLIQGPWYHVTAGMGLDYRGLNLDGVELAWFDHWMKGVSTGVDSWNQPLHLYDLATNKYTDASRYPLDQATPTTFHLNNSGTLTQQAPSATQGADTLAFSGQIPCTSGTEQWAAGLGPLVFSFFGLADPCTQSVNLSQLGPGTQSYTTAPFSQPTTLAGPVGATLYASANTIDSEWVVQLSDVAPNGNATALTSGLLDGQLRALDPTKTWNAADGLPLLPYHPYTKASQAAVTPGKVERYDVEVFPVFDTLQAGHRLRVTIATSDFPHALPDAAQLPGLLGGVYQLQRSSAYPSSVELPLADPASFRASGSAGGCIDRRGFTYTLHHGRGARVVKVELFVNGKLRLLRRGHALRTIRIKRPPLGVFTVRIINFQSNGARITSTRIYRGCAQGRTVNRTHHAKRSRGRGR